MTSNDLVIPVGIRLRIPCLLAFPGQVSCGEKPRWPQRFPLSSASEVQKVKTNTGGEECVFPRKSKILSIMYKTDEMYTAVSWHQ